MAKLKSKNQIITNAVRCSYVNLFEAGKPGEMNEGKYSVSLIIPKSDVDTLKVIREAITNVFKENETSKLKGVTFDKARSILHDGDIERPEDENYANSFYLNAKSTRKPVIWNQKGEIITDANEFYSGVWAMADLTFYAYDAKANKGISVSINAAKKIKDDEVLAGATVSFNDFDDGTASQSTDWDNL